MSARFWRMAARLWPASLFGRLAMILFSGLVAAHVLAFVLIVLDHITIQDEAGSKFAAVDIADAVAILDYVKPEERPAWLDRLSRTLAGGVSRREALRWIGGGVAAVAVAGLLPREAQAAEDKVDICHRTGSATNPVVLINVSTTLSAITARNSSIRSNASDGRP